MEQQPRFDIRFDKSAGKEYQKLTQPALEIVTKKIDELMYRADEIGKPLSNKRTMHLAGCREIKLRDAGVRIVYRVTNEQVDILRVVYILTIEKRSRDLVFKIASDRHKVFKTKRKDLLEILKRSATWDDKKR